MRRRRQTLQVSTFPFLAVLLCTMGSLLLVLLAVDRKAKLAARQKAEREVARLAAEAEQAAAAGRAEAERKRQQARALWQQERDALHTRLVTEEQALQIQMQKLRGQLAEAAARLRAEVGGTDELREQTAAQRQRVRQAEEALAGARATAGAAAAQTEAERKALARMTADLLQLERALAELKAARERERQTYSVVPYNGRRGESRRPLYVECGPAGVVFHPERLAMSPAADPDAVRAEVERRIARQRDRVVAAGGPAPGVPYLMLLVRPDGIANYYLLQKALHGLTLDFGYEFIDPDWVLDFPATDEGAVAQPWMTVAQPPAGPRSPPGPSPPHGARIVGLAPTAVGPPGAGGGPGGSGGGAPAGGFGPGVGGGAGLRGPGGRGVVAGGPGWEGLGSGFAGAGTGGNGSGPRSGAGVGGGLSGPGAPGVAAGGAGTGGAGTGVGGTGAGPAGSGSGTGEGGNGGAGLGSPIARSQPVGLPPAGLGVPSVGGGGGPFPAAPGALALGNPAAGGAGPGNGGGAAGAAPTLPALAAGQGAGGLSGTGATATSPHDTNATTRPPGGTASATPPGPGDVPGPPGAPGEGTPARPGAPRGVMTGGGGGGQARPEDEALARFAPPVLPGARPKGLPPRPVGLRPAQLHGARPIFLECQADAVVLLPARREFPVAALTRDPAGGPLVQAVRQALERQRAAQRPDDPPFRPQVVFLVRPDGVRTYHLVYPLLAALPAAQWRRNLHADEDVFSTMEGP